MHSIFRIDTILTAVKVKGARGLVLDMTFGIVRLVYAELRVKPLLFAGYWLFNASIADCSCMHARGRNIDQLCFLLRSMT